MLGILKEVHLWFEIYVMNFNRIIIAYQFVGHEVEKKYIFNFGPMIGNDKDGAACRDTFQFITYMASQGSK